MAYRTSQLNNPFRVVLAELIMVPVFALIFTSAVLGHIAMALWSGADHLKFKHAKP